MGNFCHNPTSMTSEEDMFGYMGDFAQAGSQILGRITEEVNELVKYVIVVMSPGDGDGDGDGGRDGDGGGDGGPGDNGDPGDVGPTGILLMLLSRMVMMEWVGGGCC